MNKLKKIIGIVLCALVLTGCELKYEGQIEITEDGKMDMSVIMAYDRELISTLIYLEENDDLLNNTEEEPNIPEASITEIRKFLEDNKPEEQEGLEISRYEKNSYYGYQLTYEIPNIDNVSSDSDVKYVIISDLDSEAKNDKTYPLMFKKDKDTYYANFTPYEADGNNEGSISMINMSATLKVTLPTKPLEHNANEVSEDGKTLSWNIDSTNSDNIKFSFKLKDTPDSAVSEGLNTEMIMLIAGIIIIVIIIVVVLVLFARNNKKLDKSLEVLDQTIPSAAPKTTNVVENNTNIPAEKIESAPPVSTPSVGEPISVPAQNTQNIEEHSPVAPIEVVPVVESIPVVNNTQPIEESTKESNEIKVENKEVPNIAPNPTSTINNLEEMPIIMEPSITPAIPNTQIINEQASVENQAPNSTQETIETVEETNATEDINTPVIEDAKLEEQVTLENKLDQTNEDLTVNNITETQVSNPVIEQTTVETLVQVVEPVTTPVQETNIFDTPNMTDTNIQVEETPKIPEPPLTEINNAAPIIEPITSEPTITNVVQKSNIVETPSPVEPVIQEFNIGERIKTITINDTPTVEPKSVIPAEPVPTIVEEKIEPPVENVITTETISTTSPVTTDQPTMEEPKLEVLETNNTTLEEPDIPLPEPVVEEPVPSAQTLEEAPVIEEPTGNRFIQTDFMDNKSEELKEEDKNM